MWNRKDVKAKGKEAFKRNYWKCVATALLIAVVAGGGGSIGGNAGGFTSSSHNGYHQIVETSDTDEDQIAALEDNQDVNDTADVTTEDTVNDSNVTVDMDGEDITPLALGIFAMIFGIIILAASAIGVVLKVFLFNPVKLGCDRFFRRNLEEPAQLENIVFAFKSHYKNVTKILFLQDLYIFLWSLLFIIPGIVKTYEYRMVSYLLTENPEMSKDDAFAESKRLMNGNKWKAFVLDLSFIGWDLLSLCTCGILSIFYVNPYKHSTNAALYEALKYGNASVPANV